MRVYWHPEAPAYRAEWRGVAEIISIAERQRLDQERKAAALREHKARLIDRTLQRTAQGMQCEKCGSRLTRHQPRPLHETHHVVPYRFCDVCDAEYRDFIAALQGRGNAECYWHNEDWQAAWRSWVDYQGTLDRFIKSKEFLRLMRELKTPEGGE
jgi:hypothetical protein